MDEQTRFQQADIGAAHRDRARGEYGGDREPMYGLEAIAGGHGEAPIEESAEDEAAAEAGRPGETTGVNMTWAIILGGVMLLGVVVLILILGVGYSYSSDIVTSYPAR